ncbi:hypothetical protein THAOC_05485, partial [Thalassiosira oceanica]
MFFFSKTNEEAATPTPSLNNVETVSFDEEGNNTSVKLGYYYKGTSEQIKEEKRKNNLYEGTADGRKFTWFPCRRVSSIRLPSSSSREDMAIGSNRSVSARKDLMRPLGAKVPTSEHRNRFDSSPTHALHSTSLSLDRILHSTAAVKATIKMPAAGTTRASATQESKQAIKQSATSIESELVQESSPETSPRLPSITILGTKASKSSTTKASKSSRSSKASKKSKCRVCETFDMGTNTCDLCPDGQVDDQPNGCAFCPEGEVRGNQSGSQCSACVDANDVCNGSSFGKQGQCEQCPTGK